MTKKMIEEHQIVRVDASTPIGEPFRSFLKNVDPNIVCSKCGGIPYDIVFSHEGVLYKFCLYKIQKEDNILAETDYEKLHEYTKKGGPMMRQRR
jgi:hypothetical protein